MDAIEKRALELLAAAYKATEYPPMVHESHGLIHGRLDRREQAAVEAIIAALTPPEGYVLVPVEPTEAMLQAGYPRNERLDDTFDRLGAWADMLAARPEVPGA